jgi:glycosyltransferase involved in cell wall biosynthesis
MPESISACITAGNEEKNIRRCLESVKWADEIIVVDSFSEDRTPEISREYTDRVYQHEWLGYIGQKTLVKEMANSPWVLFIDADEEVSPELRDEIGEEFQRETCAHYAGYEFPRKVHYLERWILHGDWYPDIKLRLFRKERGTCGGREPHDRMTVDGPVKRLISPIHHYTYDNIADQIATVNRFSAITAESKYAEGQRCHMHDLLFRPLVRFVRGYLLRRGFMDGLPGLIIAMTTSYGVFAKYAKLWEIDLRARHGR